ncbi:MAG TPA: CsgG/HfaB family protein, partial [Myxococcota bacterium]
GWAQEDAREESGASLAQALLLAGVRHTLAPLWSVPDADALAGVPFGECARRARRALLSSSTSPLSFAGYVLYGDPRTTMPAADARLPAPGRTRSGEIPAAADPPTAPEQPRSDPAVPAPFLGATTSSTAFVPRDRPRTDASTPRTNPNARWSPENQAASQPQPARSPMILAGVVGLLVGVLAIGALVTKPWASSANAPNANTPNTNTPNTNDPRAALAAIGAVPSAPVVRTGPVRISVMPFKASGSGDVALAYLSQGLAEVMVTALSEDKSVKLIERGQIDVDVGEIDFEQTKYVDPATRALLGKISGAEIVVLGSYQPAGDALRFTARFVDVTTGEVVAAAKVDGSKSDVFGLEDKLAADVKATMSSVVSKVRK